MDGLSLHAYARCKPAALVDPLGYGAEHRFGGAALAGPRDVDMYPADDIIGGGGNRLPGTTDDVQENVEQGRFPKNEAESNGC